MSQVLSGDADIGHLLPIPTESMQLFDECRGEFDDYSTDLLRAIVDVLDP